MVIIANYYVWLDAGHSKMTAGKRNTVASPAFYEYEFNNDIAIRLKKRLEAHGITVYLTNTTPNGADISLTNRANIANNKWKELGKPSNAIFVSLHGNASSGPWAQARGVEVYHASNASQKSKDLALLLTNQIYEDIKKVDSGFKNRGRKQADFTVIYKANMRAVLIEHAFYDNKNDLNLLQNHRDVFVEADCKAICKHLGIEYRQTGVVEAPIKETTKEPVKNYCVLYGNDVDKVAAEIICWGVPNAIPLHVDQYNGGYWGVIIIGGPAKEQIDAKFKINYTSIIGVDRYDTVRKALEYIKH